MSRAVELGREQMSRAVELADIAISMLPEPGEESKSEIAAAWWLRGVLYYEKQNYLAAEQSFRLALNADPQFEEGRRALVRTMLRSKDRTPEAVKEIEQLGNYECERLLD